VGQRRKSWKEAKQMGKKQGTW